MVPEEKIWTSVKTLMKTRGQKALETSKQAILQEKINYEPLREALRYFMEEFWFDTLHPTLISIACEAVGGNPDETVNMGAAMVLLAGAADIHDDIIDQTTIKEPRPTVFGKFGRDIAILAGDALLLKGIYLLHEACATLPKDKKQEILDSVKRNFFDISSGVAKETSFRGKTDISQADFLEIVRQKVATAETSMRIGAILGNGTKKETELLAHYGSTLGFLLSLRDEFIDVFEADELKNRFENECLPLPILLALHDDSKKSEILKLLQNDLTEEKIERLLDLSIDCKENKDLISYMKHLVEAETESIVPLKSKNGTLVLLLKSTTEDL